MYFMMNRFYIESFNESGVELGDGYYAKSEKYRNNNIICTVYSKGTPVITSGIATNDSDYNIWETLHNTSYNLLSTSINTPPYTYPYIAERLEIGAVTDVSSLSWVGDFTKSIGWIHLASKELRVASLAYNDVSDSKYLRLFK